MDAWPRTTTSNRAGGSPNPATRTHGPRAGAPAAVPTAAPAAVPRRPPTSRRRSTSRRRRGVPAARPRPYQAPPGYAVAAARYQPPTRPRTRPRRPYEAPPDGSQLPHLQQPARPPASARRATHGRRGRAADRAQRDQPGPNRAARTVTRKVIRASKADGALESGLTALIWNQVLSYGTDAMITVSLAGTVFFGASANAQRGNVLLYLLITMAPFAVVAPVIGPAARPAAARPPLDDGRHRARPGRARARDGRPCHRTARALSRARWAHSSCPRPTGWSGPRPRPGWCRRG